LIKTLKFIVLMNVMQHKIKNLLPHKLYKLAKKITRSRSIAIIFAVASTFSIIATYFAIANSQSPFESDQNLVVLLIIIDLILLLSLAFLITRRLSRLIMERRRGIIGSRLQTRIVMMFSLVAMVPTIIMVISSAIFFNYGIQSWFNNKVSKAIDGSVDIARSYLEENKNIIRADIAGMASDINRDALSLSSDPVSFNHKLSFLAAIRKLPEALIFQKIGYGKVNIVASTSLSFSLQLDLQSLGKDVLEMAEKGELVTITSDKDDRVIALTRLDNFFDTYLLVGRFVDNKIINYIESTEGAAAEYKSLRSNISKLQIKFFVVFVIVSLLLLLATAWVGFVFAVYIVKPISSLLEATERVKKGDLTARVKQGPVNDEMATLSRAFNRMTEQLARQRDELISAQRRVAWADVARRIAHEIKNPLTPIQLAAERLKKKYSSQLEDGETFDRYLNTIARNVNSIGAMVDEFANFARIPAPIFEKNNMCDILEDSIFAREGIVKEIEFSRSISKKPIMINCDAGQITQVLTNLIKNAEESIIERQAGDKKFVKGIIKVKASQVMNKCGISIKDNGKGFADEIKARITEPYVTTKSKGTGLGLAIVKKIVEDHSGTIEFKNVSGGACVYLSFPLVKL